MLRLIMVPLDGSKFAEQALPLALAIARRSNARLDLVAVRPSYPIELIGTEAHEYLETIAAQLHNQVPAGISTRVLLCEGGLSYPPPVANSIAAVLMRHVSEHEVDTVVMSTHGRGGFRRAWLGSVADAMVRLSTVPVLLVKPQDEEFTIAAAADGGIPHIIVPLDGSAQSERVLDFALRLGEPFGARYTLLRVMMLLGYHYDSVPDYIPELVSPMSRQTMEQYLEGIAAPLRLRGLQIATEVIQHTSAPAAIAEYAATHGGALIAMATSGSGGMRRLMLGSVADKVIRSADVPVLVCNVHQIPEQGRAIGAATISALAPS